MRITYLGHAGFCVETEPSIVVTDPWLSSQGAFDGAWFQFPRNHPMAGWLQQKLGGSSKRRFIYISHEHKGALRSRVSEKPRLPQFHFRNSQVPSRSIAPGAGRLRLRRHAPEGGDLAAGWADGSRRTCPRRWQFELEKEGRCTSSDCSFNAVALEQD